MALALALHSHTWPSSQSLLVWCRLVCGPPTAAWYSDISIACGDVSHPPGQLPAKTPRPWLAPCCHRPCSNGHPPTILLWTMIGMNTQQWNHWGPGRAVPPARMNVLSPPCLYEPLGLPELPISAISMAEIYNLSTFPIFLIAQLDMPLPALGYPGIRLKF